MSKRQAATLQRGASQPVKPADWTWITQKTHRAPNTHCQSFCHVLVNVVSRCIGGVAPELLNLGDARHHLQVSEENCRGVSLQNHLVYVRRRMLLPTRLLESVSIAWESANFCSASRTKITSVLKCSATEGFLISMYFGLQTILLCTAGCWNWRALAGQSPQYPRSDPVTISFPKTHFKQDLHSELYIQTPRFFCSSCTWGAEGPKNFTQGAEGRTKKNHGTI